MFSAHVSSQLKSYVYRLIDPRNGETFYVGKGVGNRVFDHAAGQIIEDNSFNEPSPKLSRIREIKLSGFEVQHVIHRHGLDSQTAEEVEAALIDAYSGLTNLISGKESQSVGVMHAQEVVELYEAKEAKFQHNLLMITINRTAANESIYEAVRYAWKIDAAKATRAEYVLAVNRGLIVGVFVAEQWLLATAENFEGRPTRSPRYGFRGTDAPDAVKLLYLRHRIPAEFRQQGAANPVKYAFLAQ